MADLIAGFGATSGYGHNYGIDFVIGWAAVAPDGWTAVDSVRLQRHLPPLNHRGRRRPMIRAAIYARISYDPDARAVGVDRQREDCLRLAASRGWTVVAEYIDNNVSASKYSRRACTQYLRLLDDIEAGRIDAVAIWMEDRLQRQVLELAEFLKVCDGAGVTRIASIGGEFDLSDSEQRTMLYIKAAMAEAEVEKLRRRVLRQRRQAAQNGEPHGGGRRGFGFPGAGKNGVTAEQVEQERELIRDVAARVLSGQSLNGVATEWRQRGIRTPSSNFWSPQNLRQMLLSPSIAGYRTHHGNLIQGTWKPIIPREQWELLKALLEDPARSNGRRGHPAGYLLTGLVVCGVCGHRMVVDYNRRGGGRPVRSYKCKHRPAYGGCGRVSRNAETIENLIVEALFVAVESDGFDRLASNHADDPAREICESLAHDQGLLDRLADKVAEELITAEFAKRKQAEIENRMEGDAPEARRTRQRACDHRNPPVPARRVAQLRLGPETSNSRRRPQQGDRLSAGVAGTVRS